MKKIEVKIDWCDKNFAAVTNSSEIFGVVAVTNKTLDGLKKTLQESLDFHISCLLNDGEQVPEWLIKGQYIFVYDYTLSAILQDSQRYTTLSAISRITGIKHAQLSHYANAVCRPRANQRKRVIDGLHTIGKACLAVI